MRWGLWSQEYLSEDREELLPLLGVHFPWTFHLPLETGKHKSLYLNYSKICPTQASRDVSLRKVWAMAVAAGVSADTQWRVHQGREYPGVKQLFQGLWAVCSWWSIYTLPLPPLPQFTQGSTEHLQAMPDSERWFLNRVCTSAFFQGSKYLPPNIQLDCENAGREY